MSIARLFDHTAQVYRLTETVDEYADAVNSYATQGDPLPCAIVPPKFRPAQTDAGAELQGVTEVYLAADADVEMNDVLDVTAGPEAPTKYIVLSTAHPRGHHTEARCAPFTRTLAAV